MNTLAMPLVFLPDHELLFLWGRDPLPPALSDLGTAPALRGGASFVAPLASPTAVPLITPEGAREVEGQALPLLASAGRLATVPAADVAALPASLALWTLASKLALELAARERIVPTILRRAGRVEARWGAALSASDDAARAGALARSMPPAAHAVPVAAGGDAVWAPDAMLRAYLDAVVDALVRGAQGGPALPVAPDVQKKTRGWDQRWRAALGGEQRSFEANGFAERNVIDELVRWSEPALGARDRLRACFRLELPERDRDPFVLRFLLQSPDDPSLLVPAAEVWKAKGRSLERLGRAFVDPQESLLEALGRACRVLPALAPALEHARPEMLELDPAAAWSFLGEGASALASAGFGVIVPAELTAAGQRRLRLRMRVSSTNKIAGVVAGSAGLGMGELLAVDWQAVIGEHALSAQELGALARQKAPLVRFRGAWVAIDPRELTQIQARIAAGPGQLNAREAIAAALAGEAQQGELSVAVSAAGTLAELLERLHSASDSELAAPRALQATLRPYQQRGLRWLTTLASLGLGACLADDMGLGKTIQLLAFLLRRSEHAPHDDRPALLVAPTSVIGNWQREIERFAPSLRVVEHYGSVRVRSANDFPRAPGTLVLTSYGLLRRDAALLAAVDWSLVALDEAQNIKNAASATARAARSLRADQRFALTGTPVENRLAELWSILEFANPGMLGPLDRFRREVAIPVERYGNDEAAARLRRMVAPFVLRRVKSDPAIAPDLPAKHEMKVVCTLTREQASLYKAVVDEELRKIAEAEGIERRGRVLALLTHTKQICNHPAHYLGERGPLPRRSGKLARATEMLEEALAAGDKALVFTQFREMGDKLAEHFALSLGCEVLFLHGGTPRRTRDELVRRFQEEPRAAPIFVLSVKAGGTGLNLTAASHVFHYDRWWNPAVEDQATDRAYRIGQQRAVQVHKLVCAGTVEDKIDRLLEQKRALAAKVVGAGEQWITELAGDELRELFALSGAASVADEGDGDDEGAAPGAVPADRKRRGRRAQGREASA